MNLDTLFEVKAPHDIVPVLFEALEASLKETSTSQAFTTQFQKWLSEDVRRRMRPWTGMCPQYLTEIGCTPFEDSFEWQTYGPFKVLGFYFEEKPLVFMRFASTVEVDPFPQHNPPTVLEVVPQ